MEPSNSKIFFFFIKKSFCLYILYKLTFFRGDAQVWLSRYD